MAVEQTEKSAHRLSVRVLAEWAAIVIAASWLYAATWKFVDLAAFRTVVEAHGLVHKAWLGWLAAVPAAEIALGLAVGAACGGGHTRRLGLIAAITSLLMLLVLTVYILMVPEALLAKVGCGCHGPALTKIIAGLSEDVRLLAVGGNVLLLLLHVPLFVGRQRSR